MNRLSWQSGIVLALANLFWAGNLIVGRFIADDVPPFTLNFSRWCLVAIVLWPFAERQVRANNFQLLRKNAYLLLAFALTGITFYQSLVYAGLHYTTAINASLINSTMPVAIILCGWLIAGERTNYRQLSGVAVSILGLIWIVIKGDFDALKGVQLNPGDAFIVASLPMWGLYSVFLRKRPMELSGVSFLFLVAAFGSVTSLPAVIAESLLWRAPNFSVPAFLSILYLAFFPSIGAYLCWNQAVKRVGSNVAGCSMSLIPLFVIVLAAFLLKEPLYPFHFIGLILTVGGVLLSIAYSPHPNSPSVSQNKIQHPNERQRS